MKFGYRGRYKLKGFPDRFRLHDVTPGEAPSPTPVLLTGDGFVGREQERLDIRMALDRAATGSGGMLFLTGAPGVGASRLASEVAAEAARKGWWVLSGRCAELETAPLAPFRDVLAAAVASAGVKALQDAGGDNGPLIAQLVPGLRQKVRGMGEQAEVPANQLRETLFRAVFEFLSGSQGAKPLLIVLDGLHWADDETVLLLRDIAERLGGSRIVVLGTYWDSELDSSRPFTSAASRLIRRRRAQRIVLGRLTDRDVEKMVAAMGETPLTPVQLVGIQAATEGNPLFVKHSYLYMAESETMLGGSSRSQASFTEEDLELPRLQAYHLAVADTLERVYGKSVTEKAAEIAYHLYQAGSAADPVRTSSHLAQAARNAIAVGAFEEVLRLVERNLQLLPADRIRERAEALALRGQAYFGLARNNDAKAAWSGALGRYEELGDSNAAAGIKAQLNEIRANGEVASTRPARAHEGREEEAPA